MGYQKTLMKSVFYSGIGLHSGKDVNISFNPALDDQGIVFSRTDLEGTPKVIAKVSNVVDTNRATTIGEGIAKVATVEHILAALSALGIDNCNIELSSVEPPVMDGSSLPFISLLKEAGICQLKTLKKAPIVIEEALMVRDNDRFISVFPYEGFRITFTSVNNNPIIGIQFGDYEITEDTFVKELASARTIGFMHEIEALQAQGLALGGSLENALVYDNEKPLNNPRFEDELVRHKILDVIGDLSLVGRRIKGHIVAVKSGHELNIMLARKILEKFA
ncbi:UDP-3-O-acyl-N-acetylglucosamine deacetylase [Selenomonadales bacterium OttesenSCG-928-I06]|nr:UDP-3-O-acyl-N-acetylglucosamine deacetylase [Selenomonadales bacterium OttesenSCG-928-I06]